MSRTEPTTACHHLARHGLLRLARPARLQVDHGTVWVTLDRQPLDILLEPGDAFDYDGRTPLLAMALGGSAALTTRPAAAAPLPAPTPPGGRWPRWLAPRLTRLFGASA